MRGFWLVIGWIVVGVSGVLSPVLFSAQPVNYLDTEKRGRALYGLESRASLNPRDPYAKALFLDPDTGKKLSHFILKSQIPWSVAQSGGTCYGHAAAELLSSAYYRATGKTVIVDGQLLAQWHTLTQTNDFTLALKWLSSFGGLMGNLIDGGYDQLVIADALEKNQIFILDQKSVELFKVIQTTASGGQHFNFFETVQNPIGRSVISDLYHSSELSRLSFLPGGQPRLFSIWNHLEEAGALKKLFKWTPQVVSDPLGPKVPETTAATKNLEPFRSAKMRIRFKNLLKLLQNYIPVSIGIFTPGVEYTGDSGKTWKLKLGASHSLHAVVLMGFGVYNQKLYWIARNSWENEGKSYIRFPMSETFRIVTAHALLLNQEVSTMEMIKAGK